MSFMPSRSVRLVPGLGKGTERIAIVGDYTSMFDDRALKPFSGPNGTVLEGCLHAAGLIRSEVYLTNAFKSVSGLYGKRANTDFFNEESKKFTQLGLEHAEMLRLELDNVGANVIVPAGNPALLAISTLSSCAKYRGYVCEGDRLAGVRKIIPTYSLGSTLRGSFANRHIIVADLKKAKREADFPEIIRPERTLIYALSMEEVVEWTSYFAMQPELCFDIEVINHEWACISFAVTPQLGLVIPVGNCTLRPPWTEDEELVIWRLVQQLLGTTNVPKVVQNGIFDIHFLMTRCGIVVRGPIRDTMIGHSVMFPELPKGLDFLGSIYCGGQEYWKDAVKFDNIKEES